MSEKAVFTWNDKKFYQHDISNSISEIGIKKGDIIYVQSDLGKLIVSIKLR